MVPYKAAPDIPCVSPSWPPSLELDSALRTATPRLVPRCRAKLSQTRFIAGYMLLDARSGAGARSSGETDSACEGGPVLKIRFGGVAAVHRFCKKIL